MTEPWIVECDLSRANGRTPFWNTPDTRVRTRFLVLASDAADATGCLSASVAAGGAKLASVHRAAPATAQDRQDTTLTAAWAKLSETKPVILGPPQAVKAGAPWVETTWAADLGDEGRHAWAVVSGAIWPEFSDLVQGLPKDVAQCLFSSTDADTRALAPWLVRLDPRMAHTVAIMGRAQETHALVVLHSRRDMPALRAHLRRYTMLKTPANPDAPAYFRFFDGRVMMDMLSGMSTAFLAPFLDPIDRVTVPLTWEMLVPPEAGLDGAEPTPFDDDGATQGRLLTLETKAQVSGNRSGAAKVSGADYAVLEAGMARRAERVLARALWTEFGDLTTQDKCLDVAGRARQEASPYGLTSVKQVHAYARCMITFDGGFPALYPEAIDILESPAFLPWQKKNKLVEWYGIILFEPDRLPSMKADA